MNFYKRIREQIADRRNQVSFQDVIVDKRCLYYLLEDYERLNELVRKEKTKPNTFDHFEAVVKSEFFEDRKNYGKIFTRIAEIIKPLIEEEGRRERVFSSCDIEVDSDEKENSTFI